VETSFHCAFRLLPDRVRFVTAASTFPPGRQR
jgi:hypothetical protein